jgi:hypothetical protein
MNAATSQEAPALKPSGLAMLRAAVPEHLISPLPKGTKAQNECPNDQKISCRTCGGWHHPQVRHLSYLGHAAATHLLLEADEQWTWEPLAFTEQGLPRFDESGGLWIRLTVCSMTRLGYGHADAKQHMDKGSREKEVIGDAIRNAAMRFGLALDLWSKADLHADEPEDVSDISQRADAPRRAWLDEQLALIGKAPNVGALKAIVAKAIATAQASDDSEAEKEINAAAAAKVAKAKP